MAMHASEQELLDKKAQVKETSDQVHEQNLEVSRIYHEIETTKFNASEGYKLAKELQLVLQKRRAYKELNKKVYAEFIKMGGEKRLKALQNKREKYVRKIVERKGWYSNFSDEAMEILNRQLV